MDIQELNSAIHTIAQRTLNNNSQLPHIYTAIVDEVLSNGDVVVHFAYDGNENKCTFTNLSCYTPSTGDGVYVLTTGGDGLTGAFVIATSGRKINTIDSILTSIEAINTTISSLNARVTALENK